LIADAVRRNAEELVFPESPKPLSGSSSNPMFGFSFNSEAAYHKKSVLTDFLSQMFVRNYADLKVLEHIDTTEELVNAIRGCTDPDNIDSIYQGNLTSFLDQMCSCKNYIVDTSAGENSLGNTLGEMSLAYFKYIVEQETERSVFLIDQPEDHISNNNISKKLLSYFNSIRNKKQIIMVTHNPLLVVNQDVDNVIFVRKNGDNIDVISGCLEQEGEKGNILDIVASNMDGGKESIEKRLKVYG
jgi:predicted ATPase